MSDTGSNTFKVGFLFFVALVVLGAASVSVGHLDFWKKTYDLRVDFKNVGGLKEGDPVRVSGLELGRVERLDLVPGRVIATLRMHGKIDIRENYDISVAMSSLVGGRHIAIEVGDPAKPAADTSQVLHGKPPSSPLDEIGELVTENRKSLREFMANLDEISTSLKTGKGTLGKLLTDDSLYNEAKDTMTEVKTAVAGLKGAGEIIAKVQSQLDKGEGTLAKLLNSNDVYDSLKASADRLQDILTKMNNGEGTAGKLLNDPALYDDAKALMAQLKDAAASMQRVVDKIDNGKGPIGRLLNDEKLAQDIADTMDQAREVAGSVREITDKINNGNGTISKLINESGLYDQAESTLTAADKLLGPASRTKTYVTVGTRYYADTKLIAPYGALQIFPTEDRYFEIGGVAWPAGKDSPWEFPEKYKDSKSKVFVQPTVLLGFKFMDGRLDLAAGFLEGKVGGRASYRFTVPYIDHDVTLAVEARDGWNDRKKLDQRAGKFMARVYLDTKVWRWFHVQAGVSQIAHHAEFFAGASFTYEDEDIRSFVSLIGLAK